MKPPLKTPRVEAPAPTQLEIENKLMADAMLFLASTSGRRVRLESLRPGDRLIGWRRVAYVVQNARTLRLVEVRNGGAMEVLNYNQVRIHFDRVQKVGLFPWWRKALVALGVYR
jgi:hypothetical protein